MSFAGLKQFESNLSTLIESAAFKESNEAERLDLGYRLLMSRYGFEPESV